MQIEVKTYDPAECPLSFGEHIGKSHRFAEFVTENDRADRRRNNDVGGEFMLCGAAAVEVGTANIFDPYAGERIVNELTKLCECDNITDVSSIIGGLKVE